MRNTVTETTRRTGASASTRPARYELTAIPHPSGAGPGGRNCGGSVDAPPSAARPPISPVGGRPLLRHGHVPDDQPPGSDRPVALDPLGPTPHAQVVAGL